MSLKLDEIVVKGLPVIGMTGNLDAHTSAALDTVVMKHLNVGAVSLALDASGLAYSTSDGLRVLLKALRVLRKRQGKLFLIALQPQLVAALKLSGMHSLLELRDTVASCFDIEVL